MYESGPPTDPRTGWWRRSRRYSPFDRSPGLRRVPDDAIAFALVGSLVLHVAFTAALINVTHAPSWAPGAETLFIDTTDAGTSQPEPSAARAADASPAAPPERPTASPIPPAAPTPARGPVVKSASSSAVPSTPMPRAPEATAPALRTVSSGLIQGGSERSPVAEVHEAGLEAAQPESPGTPAPIAATPARALTPVPTVPSTAVVGEQADTRLTEREALPIVPPAEPTRVAEPTVPTVGSSTLVPRSADVAPAKPRAASPLGLGLGPASIQLDGPRERTSDRPAEIVTGKLTGGPAEHVVVYVNGEPIPLDPEQRSFELAVPLKSGANRVRAVAIGPSGAQMEDIITIEYAMPVPVAPDAIRLASPTDGLALGPDDLPVMVVEGQVTDRSLDTAWIVVNDQRTSVSVHDGHFRQVMVVTEPVMRLWAETAGSGGERQRSQTVTVQRTAGAISTGVLVVQWPRAAAAFDLEVSATWRAQPDRLDSPAQTVVLPAAAPASDGTPNDVFYLRGLKPGVYTLAVRSRGAVAPDDIRSTFYVSDRTGISARPLGARRFNGGRVVLAKVLLPYGILWSQDEWFSGLSESVDTVTKFRVPEGISWVERKVDLP